MSRYIFPVICFCLLLPIAGWCVSPQEPTAHTWSAKSRAILATFGQRLATLWQSDKYNLYIPAYTWHNRFLYDSETVKKYNENPWGIGAGKIITDEKGDTHLLLVIEFQDSHNKFEPYGGYAYQKNWPICKSNDWSAGIGYVLGITAREDYGYIPFPLPLPIGGIKYKKLAIQSAYIPGGYNDGNVLFTWLRWDFD